MKLSFFINFEKRNFFCRWWLHFQFQIVIPLYSSKFSENFPFTIFLSTLYCLSVPHFPNIVTSLADDMEIVFMLTIVEAKFPDLLRCWASVPYWSLTVASSQFNTRSQWGVSLKWDFEQSIFIHYVDGSSRTPSIVSKYWGK